MPYVQIQINSESALFLPLPFFTLVEYILIFQSEPAYPLTCFIVSVAHTPTAVMVVCAAGVFSPSSYPQVTKSQFLSRLGLV